MDPSENVGRVVVIAGMHRSGTSLLSALMQSVGLDIGNDLLGPHESNVKGHFENLDFVRFHEKALALQGIDPVGWTLKSNLDVPETLASQALELISSNDPKTLWGWKDPRTTLFLDYWNKFLPQAKFLFVFRSPWDVVDSLFRRGSDPMFLDEPEMAMSIWTCYNRAILRFYKANPERCCLVDSRTLLTGPDAALARIGRVLDLPLRPYSSEIVEDGLFHQNIDVGRAEVVHHCFPEAFELYQNLCVMSESDQPNSSTTDPLLYQKCIQRDWLNVRRMRRLNSELSLEIEKLAKELFEAQSYPEVAQASSFEKLRTLLRRLMSRSGQR